MGQLPNVGMGLTRLVPRGVGLARDMVVLLHGCAKLVFQLGLTHAISD